MMNLLPREKRLSAKQYRDAVFDINFPLKNSDKEYNSLRAPFGLSSGSKTATLR
jgi:hypothetical protein